MFLLKNKSGFSLVEVLVAISIFTVAAVTASSLLVSIVRAEKKSAIQTAVFEDARIIMAQLADEIRNGAIDYEEYYSVCVIQNPGTCGGQDNDADEIYFGINYGIYSARFYNPGQTQGSMVPNNPDDLGIECSFGPPVYNSGDGIDNCPIFYSLSSDLNTGQNPFLGADIPPQMANAFCDSSVGVVNNDNNCDLRTGVTIDKLFLIDETGMRKTILGRKKVTNSGDYAIGKVVMYGIDSDSNGIVDTFTCDNSNFYCYDDDAVLGAKMPHLGSLTEARNFITANNITVPVLSDLEIAFEDQIDLEDNSPLSEVDFIPITPLRTTITDLKFVINPIEDPYKAFEESSMHSHPSVSIIATFDLSAEAKEAHPGQFKPFKIQTTISTGIDTRINAYPTITEIRDNSGTPPSWINTVLDPTGVNKTSVP